MIFIKILYLFLLFINIIFSYININIHSGGLLFPYLLGITACIKNNIKIDNCNLVGVSAGSWISVLYHYEKDLSDFDKMWNIIIKDKKFRINNLKNFNKINDILYNNLLNRYKNNFTNDIPISIIVSEIELPFIINKKINKFKNIEDLLFYCKCSSYIPFISNNDLYITYNKKKYIDGIINNDLKLFNKNKTIDIHKNMWNRKFTLQERINLDYNSSKRLFEYGWNDTIIHIKKNI